MAYKAFVSSTFTDLREHRRQVISQLRRSGFFVDPMEDWTAAPEPAARLSSTRVDNCDLCILLVAFRRGHLPPGQDRSITQLEYDAARKRGIDVLVYLLEEDAPWPRRYDELDKDPEVRRWRAELLESSVVGYFGLEPQSLDITSALARWLGARTTARKRKGEPFSGVDRDSLRFGLMVGWQLARYELLYDSKFEEARAMWRPIEAEIGRMLRHDGYPNSTVGLTFKQLVEGVLNYYATSSVQKHAAILVGVAAMRASLVGASKQEDHNVEMAQLAFSALNPADALIIPDKITLFKRIMQAHAKSIDGVLTIIDNWSEPELRENGPA